MAADDRSPAQKGWATRRVRQAHEQTLATCESLRGRFMEGGEALGDADLLSVILGDDEMAVRLVGEFGSIAETVAAPVDRLAKLISPDQVAKLKAVYTSVTRVLRGEIKQRPVLSPWSAVLDYLRAAMAFEAAEQFRLLFLDKRNCLLSDEIHQTGTVDHTPVYPREVARRALEVGASAIILAHNHPSGDPTPSQADVAMTKTLAEALNPLGIAVHDHIVIGKQGHASMKALRLI